jgi:hypothetical protein
MHYFKVVVITNMPSPKRKPPFDTSRGMTLSGRKATNPQRRLPSAIPRAKQGASAETNSSGDIRKRPAMPRFVLHHFTSASRPALWVQKTYK